MASPPASLPAHAPPPPSPPLALSAAAALSALPDPPGDASAAPSSAPAKKGRGAGRRLTDRERLAILEELDKGAGVSNAAIARRYGITRAAVQKLKANGAEVKARYRHGSVGLRDERRRGSHSVSVPFERELFEWVRALKARKVPVPPSLVKEKAKLLVPKYALGAFQASNGWYYNFCRRFSLTSGVLVEDKVDASQSQPPQQTQQVPQPPQQVLQQPQPVLQQLPSSSSVGGTSGGGDSATTLAPPSAIGPPAAMASAPDEASKSDRILQLLEKQAALIDRQTRVSEQQSQAMQKLLAFLVSGQADGPSAQL